MWTHLSRAMDIDTITISRDSKFIKEFSQDMPFFYGLFSILFAVSLGISAAFIRRSISNFRKKYFNKAAKQTK